MDLYKPIIHPNLDFHCCGSFLSPFSRFIGIPVPTFLVKPWKITTGDAYVTDPPLKMASIMTCTWKTGMFCQLVWSIKCYVKVEQNIYNISSTVSKAACNNQGCQTHFGIFLLKIRNKHFFFFLQKYVIKVQSHDCRTLQMVINAGNAVQLWNQLYLWGSVCHKLRTSCSSVVGMYENKSLKLLIARKGVVFFFNNVLHKLPAIHRNNLRIF